MLIPSFCILLTYQESSNYFLKVRALTVLRWKRGWIILPCTKVSCLWIRQKYAMLYLLIFKKQKAVDLCKQY